MTPRYLNSRQVRERYGSISDMSLWRWLNNEALRFPKPLIINNRRFWDQSSLEEWERTRSASPLEAA